ncbi:hypothetical protein SAMN02799630_00990 [Paenibacillus sp. UNCCL117]|uniref:hypothetical protein n=1 Tax=unclassified Paenibacillus TaxID=185978 RepID=UPI00088332C4|nr:MULTISPECIES: hypothetical protein [unclassified Paenibacillus]SDC27719.1 hypothetical protein SAMN04488602_101792 [Paenibacillus sp. cl123]SFW20397.1 hypothetical protein SAMN02799630_00990 [Paenibacillus sp. UNCCL117]
MNPKFNHQKYVVRKQILSLVGAKIDIFDMNENPILFSKMKAFKLKEDIRIYGDDTMQECLISIQARSVIDFSSTFDVVDVETGNKIGALRRKGMKSIFKDEWTILNPNDSEIGLIKEDNALLALLRRFMTNLIPQHYNAELNGSQVAEYKQNFNPFVQKLNVDFAADYNGKFDRRLGLAAAVLLIAVEGNQG